MSDEFRHSLRLPVNSANRIWEELDTGPVRIGAPVVDEITVREITEYAYDIIARPVEAPGLLVQRRNHLFLEYEPDPQLRHRAGC